MNTISTYTGKSLSKLPFGCEPTKAELARRLQIVEEILQAVLNRMGEKEKIAIGPMAIAIPDGEKYILYEAPEGTEKHITE